MVSDTKHDPKAHRSIDNTTYLKVKRTHPEARAPTRGTAGAAGYDLYACKEIVIPARSNECVETGLQVEFSDGYYARIAPRSGLAKRHKLDVGAGVLDFDYRGDVGVILFNHSDQDYHVNVGGKIAQMILEKIATPPVEDITSTSQELSVTERGENGFGSTGLQ